MIRLTRGIVTPITGSSSILVTSSDQQHLGGGTIVAPRLGVSPLWLPVVIIGFACLVASFGLIRYHALIRMCNRVQEDRCRIDALLRERANLLGSDDAQRMIEEKISRARAAYDREVLDFNTRIETYPDAFFAHALNLMPVESIYS